MIHSSTTKRGNKMNKDKIIALLEDGAYLDFKNNQFFHPSFRKGWIKMRESNISWKAADRMHGMFGTKRLQQTNEIYKLV
jgi:hypothetical protein